ncbi:MAG TPA: ferrochelatase [Candidatus Acidoferrales bacterium]|nr:ferrochelatase [Candidatus Acidoferrales bacterium]
MGTKKKIGVVLFQLGGPDSLEAVEGFLYNLFCDPEIINFMGASLARRPLARWIARRRSEIVRSHYEAIGGKSPILELTNRQASALAAALAPEFDARVVVAMRYWHPLTHEAIQELIGTKYDQLILLPLYPHYSFATTGSSLKEWQRHYRSDGVPLRVVNDFHEHPLYIQAVTERINEALRKLSSPDDVHLVFSAHGLPMSLVEQGDPYPKQIETTVRLVREAGKWPSAHTLCYQSRVGKQKWLEPSLVQTIERLAKSGTTRMLVIPISFVTEHIETLHEINIEAREEAENLGVKDFHVTRALDDSPTFIGALADLVTQAAEAGE